MASNVVLVTGATHGLGYETALAIAEMGASVLITARDQARGEAAVREIIALSGNPNVKLFVADFSSLTSIRACCAAIRAEYPKLDVLINNVGTSAGTRRVTEDGFEEVFQVNVLGPLLLTELLLPILKSTSPSRIVFVGSDAHKFGRIDFDNLMSERHFGSWKSYANSKLAVMICALELAEQLQRFGVTVNIAHPGGVRTNIWNVSGFAGKLIGIFGAPFMVSAKVGAATQTYLATSTEVAGITGGYYARSKPATLSPTAKDAGLRKTLFERCLKMIGETRS